MPDGLLVAETVAAGILWICFAYKLRALLRGVSASSRVAARALVALLGLGALSITLQPKPAPATIDPLVHLPGTVRLTSNLLTMASCCALQVFLLALTHGWPGARRRVRIRLAVLAAAAAATVLLFALDHPAVAFGKVFAGPSVYVYLAYLTYSLIELVTLFWAYARVLDPIDRPLLPVGMRIVSIGCLSGFGYALLKLAYLIAVYRHITVPENLDAPFWISGALLIPIGLTLPSWGKHLGLETLARLAWRRRTFRALAPLWTLIGQSCPEVIAPIRPRRLRLYRRTVEILDGQRQLLPYLTPTDTIRIQHLAHQDSLDNQERETTIAAAQLILAAQRRLAHPDAAPPDQQPIRPADHRNTDESLDRQASALATVSRALTTPATRNLLTHLQPDTEPELDQS